MQKAFFSEKEGCTPYLILVGSSVLLVAMLRRSAINREAEKANHHAIGNRASRRNGAALMAKDAMRVANTQKGTATRRLRGERK